MSEFDWIERYLKPLVHAPGAFSLSNDVAILNTSSQAQTIVTMDTLVGGTHFLDADPVWTLAKKLVRVNVSDILSKGAKPGESLLSLALPHDFPESDFAGFCEGLGEENSHWNISLLGGDLVRTSGPLTLTLTLTGQCLPGAPTTRSGALPGDLLFVTGQIGHGHLGLLDARAGTETLHSARYRVPDLPPLEIADLVSQFATASLDVSDGLLSDALHVARQSGVEIEMNLSNVPFAIACASSDEALKLATGGDDYQTLLTAKAADLDALMARAKAHNVPLTQIGRVINGRGLSLKFKDRIIELPDALGYAH